MHKCIVKGGIMVFPRKLVVQAGHTKTRGFNSKTRIEGFYRDILSGFDLETRDNLFCDF